MTVSLPKLFSKVVLMLLSVEGVVWNDNEQATPIGAARTLDIRQTL